MAMGYSSGDASSYTTVDLVPCYEKLYKLSGPTTFFVTVAGSIGHTPSPSTAGDGQQQVTTAGATGGTFTLSLPGIGTTSAIPWNAPASFIQNALANLLGVGNAIVTAAQLVKLGEAEVVEDQRGARVDEPVGP